MMASVSMYTQAPIPLMIDVVRGSRLVTISVNHNEKCSVVLDKCNLRHGDCTLTWNSKPLNVCRAFVDYEPPSRFTIEVRGLLQGGGTFSLFFRICFFSVFPIFSIFFILFFLPHW